MRILLVEDDLMLAEGIKDTLVQAGYTADWVISGEAALHSTMVERFAAVILDLGLPGMDGIGVIKALRQRQQDVPVMILSAREETYDRVKGLDAGADDYLVKPFDTAELLARLRALLRRHHGQASNHIAYGALTIDTAGQQVYWQNQLVLLTLAEFKLLRELVTNSGKVLTRDQLVQVIYGWDESAESNVLEVHIHNLRRKISKSLINTVRGVGYLVPANHVE